MGLSGDVKSPNGTINFKPDFNGPNRMTLNQTGLGIGTSPSANLHVQGNAVVTGQLFVGGSSGSANLNIHGSIGFGFENISVSTTLSGNSHVFVDSSSGNVIVSLPDASGYDGVEYTIKKTSLLNQVSIRDGGYIDNYSDITLAENSLGGLTVISSSGNWHILSLSGNGQLVAADNLVGWWKLDETSGTVATDSATIHDGALSSGFGFSSNSQTAIINQGLNFNNNGRIVVSDHDSLDSAVFTITAWAKLPHDADNQAIFSKWVTHTADGFTLFKRRSGLDDKLYFWNGPNNRQIGGVVMADDEWEFVCAVVDNNNVTIYQNAIQTGSSGILTPHVNVTTDVTIGAFNSGGGGSVEGIVDDVRYYNKTLTLLEIQALYNQRF